MNFFEKALKGKNVEIINDAPQKYDNGVIEYDWGLGFEEDWGLVIYGDREIKNAESLKDFVGEKIISILETEVTVILNFTHEKQIIVSLEEKDGDSPEVMLLQRDKEIFVWRYDDN
jgi:hypothetical protein